MAALRSVPLHCDSAATLPAAITQLSLRHTSPSSVLARGVVRLGLGVELALVVVVVDSVVVVVEVVVVVVAVGVAVVVAVVVVVMVVVVVVDVVVVVVVDVVVEAVVVVVVARCGFSDDVGDNVVDFPPAESSPTK